MVKNMKVVIDGKVYNTQNSQKIACWENHYNCTDFYFEREELYKTKKGNWFLIGEGGALSKYSRRCGNGSTNGDGQKALTPDEAKEWLVDHDFQEEALNLFEFEEA